MIPRKRITTHPGEILQEEFLSPLGISQSALARHIGVHAFVINELVHGKRGVSVRMATMLSKAFGTSPEFWMSLQSAFEMSALLQSPEGDRLQAIQPIARTS